MPLWDIRNQFIEATGDYDLGTIGDDQDGADNGADKWINAGQRYLDQRTPENPRARRRYQKDIAAGDFFLQIEDLRTVYEVWRSDDDGRKPLRPAKYADLRREFPKAWGDNEADAPRYWTANVHHLAPEQDDLCATSYDEEFTREFEDLIFDSCAGESDKERKTGVLIMPPADDGYTIQVIGLFYSKRLAENCDSSYWTEAHPDLLVAAACYKREAILMRNSQGARDYLLVIEQALKDLDRDMAQQALVGHLRLRG